MKVDNRFDLSRVRLSPRPPRRRESKRHLFVVGSLDGHTQNEKEKIRPRRLLPAARTTLQQGGGAWFNFAFFLRRELPAPGAKGGLFCICVDSTKLT